MKGHGLQETYKLRCECGARITLRALPDEARRAMDDFNRRHAVCAPAEKWRCGVCGCLLLLKDRCPVHPASGRVRWTHELADAYWATVRAHAVGTKPAVPLHEGAIYATAVDLVRRWAGHRVIGLRLTESESEEAS
jgi:hypothetical protein